MSLDTSYKDPGDPAGGQERTIVPADVRVLLLADHQSLRSYGPVLRHLAAGLIDDVSEMSLLCRGESVWLEHVPSPPVRLIREGKVAGRFDPTELTITMRTGIIEKLLPARRAQIIAQTVSPFKPTLIHGLCERQSRLAERLSQLLEVPYVISVLSGKWRDLQISSPWCGGILAASSRLARLLRHKHAALSSRIQLVPIGTHVAESPCCFDHDKRLPYILCISPLQQGRGLTCLMNAAKRLTMKGHQFNLIVAGSGPAEHDLRRHVEQLDLAATIHFVGSFEKQAATIESYSQVFRSADIFVQPYPSSSWQPELLAAMSVGNAAIVADGVENDLVVPDKTTLSVPFEDEKALTESLDQLLSDPQGARQLAQGAQAHLRKHFTASNMLTRLAKAYYKAIKTGRVRFQTHAVSPTPK